MKVYVVLAYNDFGPYEGYGAPTLVGVYKNKESAEKAHETFDKYNNGIYERVAAFEYISTEIIED